MIYNTTPKPAGNRPAPTLWVVTEGMAGTENQCLGIAEAMGIDPVVKRINLRAPWKWLSPYIGFENGWTFTTPLKGPWPDIVIAAGRKAIAASRYIKQQSADKTFIAFVQDPRIDPDEFDLIILPMHDKTRGPNVITTLGAPNRITPAMMNDARGVFDPGPLPSPRVAVLIGGNSKTHKMTAATTEKIAGQLRDLADHGYGLMVTASRRTGEDNKKILENACAHPNIYFWDGTAPNPYMAFLAHADFILVTNDSVSMLSDAATTGKPTYVLPLEGRGDRLDALYANLAAHGAIRPFNGSLAPFSYAPLRDAALAAAEIKTRTGL